MFGGRLWVVGLLVINAIRIWRYPDNYITYPYALGFGLKPIYFIIFYPDLKVGATYICPWKIW